MGESVTWVAFKDIELILFSSSSYIKKVNKFKPCEKIMRNLWIRQ